MPRVTQLALTAALLTPLGCGSGSSGDDSACSGASCAPGGADPNAMTMTPGNTPPGNGGQMPVTSPMMTETPANPLPLDDMMMPDEGGPWRWARSTTSTSPRCSSWW